MVLIKILIYYFHERVWALVPWGKRIEPDASTAPRFRLLGALAALRRRSCLATDIGQRDAVVAAGKDEKRRPSG